MENSKNKTDNFLKAIKKYADEQRSAIQTEVAQLKEEKLKEATEKGRHDSEKYIKDKLEESRNKQTGILAKKIQEGQKKLFLERAEMTESVFKKAEEKLVEYTKTLCWSIITQGNKAKLRQSPQRLFLVSNNYMLTNWYFLPKGR